MQSEEGGTSLNQFVPTAAAEKLSALQVAEFCPAEQSGHSMLFAPGIADLFRIATEAEVRLWTL